jgi:uncharacterized membrane-anchored protein
MNPFLKLLNAALLIGGSISLLLGLIAGGAALLSSVDRVHRGWGLLSADVEVFGLIALICCVLGGFSLIIARRIGRRLRHDGNRRA